MSNRRTLWQPSNSSSNIKNNNNNNNVTSDDNYDALWRKYAKPCPRPQSFLYYVTRTLVVVQEISLTVNFLLRYQISLWEQEKGRLSYHARQLSDFGSLVLVVTFLLVILLNTRSPTLSSRSQTHSITNKARQRLTDACLIGIILRFLSSLLQSLTASYADDAVETLVLLGMTLHLLMCDYAYANGEAKLPPDDEQQQLQKQHPSSSPRNKVARFDSAGSKRFPIFYPQRRPAFQGGTLSLNAAFFATVLLISRLQHDSTAYVLCLLAVVFFAVFPLTRHELAAVYPATTSPVIALVTLLLCVSTGLLCQCVGPPEQLYYFIGIILFLLVVIPVWKYYLQFQKVSLEGPWDIPSADSMLLPTQDSTNVSGNNKSD